MRYMLRAAVLASAFVLGLPLISSTTDRAEASLSTDVATTVTAAAADSTVPVFRFYSPVFQSHFYTVDPVERDRILAQWPGQWSYEGYAYSAYTTQVVGTVPLFRFWSESFHGHFYTADPSERDRVRSTWPDTWAYEGVAYYVYPVNFTGPNTTPVYRFWGSAVHHHFYTASSTERDSVIRRYPDVYSYESERFRVPQGIAPTHSAPIVSPSDGDGSFTIATYPDTQQETGTRAGSRFIDRTKWLVAQAGVLDLRFVAHTGDVVNWDTDAHEQYVIAETAMDPLEEAGIPYQLSIGNHDSLATGVGGSARDPGRTYEYQRTTTTFNQFWKAADYGAVTGAYEVGKVDNTLSTFSAEGSNWLVLNLELWPRASVVDWAENLIASHPSDNVMIQTHSFLNGAADIDGAGKSATRWQYGDSSPQYVYDRLVGPYSNVKIVTSGHVGTAASKVVTTARGNNVAYFLQCMHSNTNNPTRLSQINVGAGTIDTRVYAPEDGATLDVKTLSGLTFLRG